jgi:hypothetical protein|tara:strand:- start:611 stop:805 length:195 start_codon:yes stop_codon:yes gene_type:complete
MLPQTTSNYPYLIETSKKQIQKYSKVEADNEAVMLQQSGENVEVHHRGSLLYKLNGQFQGTFFP